MKEERNYSVYVHITPSGKYYVGLTSLKPKKRWARGRGYKTQVFNRAIQKYGWNNIEHQVIASNLTKEEAEKFEIRLIAELHSNNPKYGYNVDNGGNGSSKFTEETKRKISQSVSGQNNPNFGKRLSKETREKISKANMGLCRPHTEETKKKMSQSKKGNKNPGKKVVCENMKFETVKDCAKFYGVNYSTMHNWLIGKRKMRKDFIEKGLKYLND